MRKAMITFLTLLLILIPISVFAFQNEPDRFRGIKWGTDLSKLPNMQHRETAQGGSEIYVRKLRGPPLKY